MKTRKVFTGWIGKIDRFPVMWDRPNGVLAFRSSVTWEPSGQSDIFPTKGRKSLWGQYEWPPKRVTITVEVEDERPKQTRRT